MKHFLIVTHTDAATAGLRGTDFDGRSILTHCADLNDALSRVARSARVGVTVTAAYDVTDAYNRNDSAAMFPATADDMTSPALVNLLTSVSLVKMLCSVHGSDAAECDLVWDATHQSEWHAYVAARASLPHGVTRVELLGNTSFGKIVRPEFGGQSIASGQLRPLTAFYG